MERYTMFLDWKNQHCENDYTTQSNLQIQCNPYQTTTGSFHRTRTKNFTICMQTQKTPNSQSNLEKEKWSRRNQAPWLQSILQSYSNQKSMVLGASLVMQWLRVCLPMQGTRVRALVWEDPTCRGAATPMSHNYWACVSGACAPQQERPWQWEARALRWRVAPARCNWRKPSHRNEDPTQPKINK